MVHDITNVTAATESANGRRHASNLLNLNPQVRKHSSGVWQATFMPGLVSRLPARQATFMPGLVSRLPALSL